LKLSKTSWLLIGIGIFMIISIGLGVVRYQQFHEQNTLNEKFALVQSRLNGIKLEQLSHRQKEVEQQLSQIISQSETARTTLSQPIGSINISNTLFDIAEANNVEVIEISSSGLASEELAGITCAALPLTARVEGEVTDLVSFITKLNSALDTSLVKSVGIEIPETTSEQKPTANIQMVIYTYQGD